METKLTLKDVLKMVEKELSEVNVPAEQTFTIGIHVGRALMMVKDCVNSIEKDEQKQQEEQKEEEIDLGVIDIDAEQEEKKDDA